MEVSRTKEGNFKCPNCDYSHEEKGAVRLHHYWTHGAGKDKKKRGKDPNKCVHTFEFLNPDNPQERAAINQGYIKICRGCGEIE